jgi:RNA polymerase sigma factor (sigma-70 family)
MKKEEERKDAELVVDFLQTRAEESFRSLYRRYTNILYLFALRLSGGLHQDAEDVVQETWIRAIRKLPDFNRELNLRNWLMGIASLCYKELARKNRHIEVGVRPPKSTAGNHSHPDLECLIRSLPDGCRQILVLHDLYGYTHDEIASILGIHAGTSKSQLFDARRKLKSRLSKEEQ